MSKNLLLFWISVLLFFRGFTSSLTTLLIVTLTGGMAATRSKLRTALVSLSMILGLTIGGLIISNALTWLISKNFLVAQIILMVLIGIMIITAFLELLGSLESKPLIELKNFLSLNKNLLESIRSKTRYIYGFSSGLGIGLIGIFGLTLALVVPITASLLTFKLLGYGSGLLPISVMLIVVNLTVCIIMIASVAFGNRIAGLEQLRIELHRSIVRLSNTALLFLSILLGLSIFGII